MDFDMTISNDARIGLNSTIVVEAVVIKNVPENSVVSGAPAKIISTMDGYLEKRKELYPKEVALKNQAVSEELQQWMWDEFEKCHGR